jgi:hypothetical protein
MTRRFVSVVGVLAFLSPVMIGISNALPQVPSDVPNNGQGLVRGSDFGDRYPRLPKFPKVKPSTNPPGSGGGTPPVPNPPSQEQR